MNSINAQITYLSVDCNKTLRFKIKYILSLLVTSQMENILDLEVICPKSNWSYICGTGDPGSNHW